MSEVNEFLSRHPDMGTEFREFAAQYETLAEVWNNCPRSHWMLWILYKTKYRNGEKLERYIDWLSEQTLDSNEDELEETRRRHFNYKGGTQKLEEEGKAGGLSETEVRWRRFNWTWWIATEATKFVLDDKVATAQFNNRTKRLLMAEAGIDLQVGDFDETEIRLALLKEQSDKLRETVGNPFELAGADDFHYGRRIG